MRAKVRAVVVVFLDLAGLATLTVAGWTLARPLGLAIAGLSCLVFAWILDGGGRDGGRR